MVRVTGSRPRTRIIGSGQVVRLALCGELDIASRDELELALDAALSWTDDGGSLLVELDEVEFMDCSALGVVVHAATTAASRQVTVELTGDRGEVSRLLCLSGARRTMGEVRARSGDPSEPPTPES